VEQPNIAIKHIIDGIPLQSSDFDGLLAFFVHHAGAFAENLGGANTAATFSQNICFQNDSRGATNVSGHDALDEPRNIDVGRTSDRARRIEAIEAARGLDGRLPRIHRRRDVRKILFVLLWREFGRSFAKGHAIHLEALKRATRWNPPTGRQGLVSCAILALPGARRRERFFKPAL
jgi:hypothetical protein